MGNFPQRINFMKYSFQKYKTNEQKKTACEDGREIGEQEISSGKERSKLILSIPHWSLSHCSERRPNVQCIRLLFFGFRPHGCKRFVILVVDGLPSPIWCSAVLTQTRALFVFQNSSCHKAWGWTTEKFSAEFANHATSDPVAHLYLACIALAVVAADFLRSLRHGSPVCTGLWRNCSKLNFPIGHQSPGRLKYSFRWRKKPHFYAVDPWKNKVKSLCTGNIEVVPTLHPDECSLREISSELISPHLFSSICNELETMWTWLLHYAMNDETHQTGSLQLAEIETFSRSKKIDFDWGFWSRWGEFPRMCFGFESPATNVIFQLKLKAILWPDRQTISWTNRKKIRIRQKSKREQTQWLRVFSCKSVIAEDQARWKSPVVNKILKWSNTIGCISLSNFRYFMHKVDNCPKCKQVWTERILCTIFRNKRHNFCSEQKKNNKIRLCSGENESLESAKNPFSVWDGIGKTHTFGSRRLSGDEFSGWFLPFDNKWVNTYTHYISQVKICWMSRCGTKCAFCGKGTCRPTSLFVCLFFVLLFFVFFTVLKIFCAVWSKMRGKFHRNGTLWAPS